MDSMPTFAGIVFPYCHLCHENVHNSHTNSKRTLARMKKHIGKLTGSLLVLCTLSAVAFSTPLENIRFERISTADGYSAFSVNSILQDKQGFLWFGSVDGLSRYDGYQFKVFKKNSGESTGLADNWILSMIQDADGILWLGTASGGLYAFDPKAEAFMRFPLENFGNPPLRRVSSQPGAPIPYSLLDNRSITKLYRDPHGMLWIGTWGGRILRFDPREKVYLAPAEAPQKVPDRFGSPVMDILQDSAGALWIGTFGGGLIRCVLQSPADDATPAPAPSPMQRYTHDPRNARRLAGNRVVSLLEPEPGVLLIATFDGGLSVLEMETGAFTNYVHDPSDAYSISENKVTTLFLDSTGQIWAGTFDGGVNRLFSAAPAAPANNGRHGLDFRRLRFEPFVNEELDPYSLSDNGVLAMFEDRGGVIWLGTYRGGINKYNRKKAQFVTYRQAPGDTTGLNDNTIMAICEDDSGILWIGTYHGGLNRFDRKTNTARSRLFGISYSADPHSISHNNVRSLLFDSDHVLWIGMRNGGLCRFNVETETFKCYKYEAGNPAGMLNNQVIPLCADSNGNLWLGIFGTGLSRFDKQTETFTHYLPDPDDPHSLSGERPFDIIEDRYGKIWVATFGSGINEFDPATERFTRYRFERNNPNSLASDRAICLFEDSRGAIWIGTFGGGLSRFDREAGAFVNYSKKDGLPSDAILGILEDSRGHLWLSTGKGISCFSPDGGIIKNYDRYDGLQGNVFNAGAVYKSKSGEMFFGGVNGFNAFFPDEIQGNTYIPPVVITAFRKFNQPSQGTPDAVVLEPDENFFSIEFAALDYSNPERNKYAYRLEGLNDAWIYSDHQRSVSYANLQPGVYTFRAKGSNSDGMWNERGVALTIRIRPPFWQEAWFLSVLVLGGGLIVALSYSYQVRTRIRRGMEIEKIRLLENEKVRKQVAEDFHDELGHKLTHITLFTEIVKRNIARVAPENTAYLEKIGETAKTLSVGISNFIWALDPEQDSLYDIGLFLKDFGDELFSKTGINFWTEAVPETTIRIKLPMHWRRHITLIFKEGMNNILKHAACKNVSFRVESNQDNFELVLSDDGTGFDSELYTPGKGLRNMRRRAQKLQCTLRVVSEIGRGTTLRFKGHTA